MKTTPGDNKECQEHWMQVAGLKGRNVLQSDGYPNVICHPGGRPVQK